MKAKFHEKRKTLLELAKITRRLKAENKKIVHCHGVFDLVHPGHIRHFASAKKNGDVLVVTITSDRFVKRGPGRPIFNEALRSEVLSAIELIDYVAVVEFEGAVEAIKTIRPDVYVKGPDYKNRKETEALKRRLREEQEAVESSGGKLVFTEDEVVFSSSKLINEYLVVYPTKTKQYLDTLKSKYTSESIVERLGRIRKLKILLIGDAIIDQYHYCLPMGKSSKEPIMVHKYISEETFLGGTLATANHIAALSDEVTLFTVLGMQKSFKPFILKKLKPEVKPVFFYQKDSSTIVKRRYLDAYTRQKLFQITYLKDQLLASRLESEIISSLSKIIKKYDLVLVNDFGHGMMTDKIIKLICQKANFLAVNVQANSANYGFNVITKYPRADFVCIDQQEIRLAMHDKYGALPSLIKKVYKKMKCRQMIVTKGPEGAICYTGDGFLESPALTDKIVDRVGAGDALFAISSPCSFSGVEAELVTFIGNVAGALQVQTVGNRTPIELVDLIKFITRLLK